MKLNILICTFNDGIYRVPDVLLPQREDVSYIVSFQYTEQSFLVPEILIKRPDVKVYSYLGKGLCRNRNYALSHASGDLAMIADDDVRYKPEYIDEIIDIFSKEDSLDVLLGKIKTEIGDPPYKKYPARSFKYEGLSRKYHASSVEMVFRINKIKDYLFFDERFGLGSEYLSGGEETIFLHDCLNRSLLVKYFPVDIVEHPYESSGKNKNSFLSLRTKGAVYSYVYGKTAFLYIGKEVLSLWVKKRLNPFFTLRYLLEGMKYQRTSVKFRFNVPTKNRDIAEPL